MSKFKHVKIPEKTHREVKLLALQLEITVQAFVSEAVRRELKRRKR